MGYNPNSQQKINQLHNSQVFDTALPIYGELSPKFKIKKNIRSNSSDNNSVNPINKNELPSYASPIKRNNDNNSSKQFIDYNEILKNTDNLNLNEPINSSNNSINRSLNNNNSNKGSLALTAPINWLYIFRKDIQKAIDENRCRDITINECKETINKIYESKVISNEKAMKGNN